MPRQTERANEGRASSTSMSIHLAGMGLKHSVAGMVFVLGVCTEEAAMESRDGTGCGTCTGRR
jgi:hypothetical protein